MSPLAPSSDRAWNPIKEFILILELYVQIAQDKEAQLTTWVPLARLLGVNMTLPFSQRVGTDCEYTSKKRAAVQGFIDELLRHQFDHSIPTSDDAAKERAFALSAEVLTLKQTIERFLVSLESQRRDHIQENGWMQYLWGPGKGQLEQMIASFERLLPERLAAAQQALRENGRITEQTNNNQSFTPQYSPGNETHQTSAPPPPYEPRAEPSKLSDRLTPS